MNDWKRKSLGVAAVVLLSAPSALGVQQALSATRGDIAGWMAAAGIELAYLSLAVLVLRGDLQRYARRIALTAVGAAILLNVVADYAARVPGGLAGSQEFLARFDWLHLALSIIESAPLAGLAYTIATLLHRLAEEEPAGAFASPDIIPARLVAREEETKRNVNNPGNPASKPAYVCPRCGRILPTARHQGAAKRNGYCRECKGERLNENPQST